MSPTEMEEYIRREPFKPVRLTLASGDQIIIRAQDRPFASGLALILGGAREGVPIETGARLVSIPNIVMAEWIDLRHQGRRRSR